MRRLLLAMLDERPAEHFHVRVGAIAVIAKTRRPMILVFRVVKRIGGTVDSDEALAVRDSVEQRLLARGRQRRISIAGFRVVFGQCEIAGGVETNRIELREVRRGKLTTILREGELDVLGFAQFLKNAEGKTVTVVIVGLDGVVLEAG